jgi:tetrahydromethanopterin S-methyltransferase subunit A
LPVPAFNEFNQLIDSLNAIGVETVTPFRIERIRPSEVLSQIWPVQPGDYRVFDPTSSIAIALLQGATFNDLSVIDPAGVAIIGSITTENLGVEHLVKNVVANPHIRHLVLYGNEIQGHLPGNALLMLSANGLDAQNRIVGAQGARPVLKNLTRAEADHFRSQIRVVDLLGNSDPSLLATHLSALNRHALPPCESGLRIDVVEPRRAEPAKRLKLDRSGYFVIMSMKGREQPIWVEHYANDGVLRNVIEGKDAASICATIIEMKLVSQLDHAAYLGRELAKAELSQSFEMRYIQDKAQGHSDACDACGG